MDTVVVAEKVAEGNEHIILGVQGDPSLVVVQSKRSMQPGDGAKHDVVPGRAESGTTIACNVFRLWEACGIPLAFQKQLNGTCFLARRCVMLPMRVVVHRGVHGFLWERFPHLPEGYTFSRLLVELFLRESQETDQGIVQNPLMQIKGEKEAVLFRPDQPLYIQRPFSVLSTFPLGGDDFDHYQVLETLARKAFLILEKAWQLLECRLVDLELQFGTIQEKREKKLVLAGAISNSSWHLIGEDGSYLGGQAGDSGLDQFSSQHVASLTERFVLPRRQRLIIWKGSKNDDDSPFEKAIRLMREGSEGSVEVVTQSVHKQPGQAVQRIQSLVHEIPDCVVIALVGRSNGAGPILSAATSVPVITVPASFREFPEDVWSSLRMPSDVPVMTVLDPKNAGLAALQILATRNPRLYAALRVVQEERLANFVEI